ncbi:response regulator [Bryobacter aggregatus]|uniref:response regulator n=1 Tax=Bryobacter aggregatus TaxID=360054 RepID=UPI0004E255D4|nr:response regulator [Bryobacter aggregatus]
MAKILIVEDNAVNRDMLERRLRFRGFEVEAAVDGVEGVEKAASIHPDLILMDMSLPRMNGWDATRQIKGNPETKEIPVIALTAHALVEDRTLALEAGCVGFHSKPIEMDVLLALMNRYLPR